MSKQALKAILFDLGGTLVRQGSGGVYPEVKDVLEELKSEYKLGVITNTSRPGKSIREEMREQGILCYFDVVLVSSEESVEKPDTRIFTTALRRLGVEPSEAVMVGNRPSKDVGGANSCGITSILITRPEERHELISTQREQPAYTIDGMEELPKLLDAL